MTLNQYHILFKHKTLEGIMTYFGKREIDIYFCDLMAFNDKITEKEKSFHNKCLIPYSFTEEGIVKWIDFKIPLLFLNTDVMSEDDICEVCKYKFTKNHGLIYDHKLWNKIIMKEKINKDE